MGIFDARPAVLVTPLKPSTPKTLSARHVVMFSLLDINSMAKIGRLEFVVSP